jgi:hypothetical protein
MKAGKSERDLMEAGFSLSAFIRVNPRPRAFCCHAAAGTAPVARAVARLDSDKN